MAKFRNKKSKRMTCRQRYKIIRKVSEHNKKLRKEKRKNPTNRKPKDPGVPNSLPFKEEILREAEERKQKSIDLKAAQKTSRTKLQVENQGLDEMADEAMRGAEEFENKTPVLGKMRRANTLNYATYFKELKEVVESADVILEVLDARDPLGGRCPQIEELVIGSGKKLVLVLNKIDLIPRQNLNEWLKYLRQALPTVAFKASTQSQNTNLSRSKIPATKLNEDLQSSSRCFGASFLMKVLGNYCRNKDIQTFIKVGVVGFPNVGKSSVINSLKRSRSCTVGATPGLTKTVQEVSLDKHIRILDSPGVILAKDDSSTTLALRNVVRLETLKDVISPAEVILQRADHAQLCMHYQIPSFSSSDELFHLLAKRQGKYKKGGIPNTEEGAKRLISDWNRGIIKYYTHPPQIYQPSVYLAASVVSEMSKAFDISEMEETMQLDEVAELFPGKGVQAKASEPTEGVVVEEKMEDDSAPDTAIAEIAKKKRKRGKPPGVESSELKPLLNQQNKVLKKKFKRMKRKKVKAAKLVNALSSTLDTALNL